MVREPRAVVVGRGNAFPPDLLGSPARSCKPGAVSDLDRLVERLAETARRVGNGDDVSVVAARLG
jgi:hypothetical protein